MVRKIFEKAGLIPGLQGVTQAPTATADGPHAPAKPRTAPGTMMGFLAAQSAAIHEAEELRGRLKVLEGGAPLRKLEPSSVRQSKWANRHETAFGTAEFAQLKAEIAASHGNIQPIKVRPLDDVPPGGPAFEVIYGHRRLRACQELGLEVLATIEEASDVSLFEQMERENRGRKNLSAWEQGTMYRKAIDEGLYPSLRRLAEGLNVDVSLVSKSISLARLPDTVVGAFRTPLDIQFRWAAPLAEALQKDPEGTLARAAEIAGRADRPTPAQVLAHLTAVAPAAKKSTSRPGLNAAALTVSEGRASISFEAAHLSQARLKSLLKLVEDFLRSQ